MPFEQTQPFCDEKQTSLKEFDARNEAADTIGSIPTPKISETSVRYELKTVNISLPKINIPDEILRKHEVEKYRILFQSKPQTARKCISVQTVSCAEECVLPCKSERAEEDSGNMSAKILNFSCLKCQDSTQYSPNDLQKHFEMWHHGELPSFPCEMCSFSADDFQIFKQHRKTHRNTFVKCDICNSERSYTLLDLTKHFTSNHCVNGNFQCEECRFFTQDVGTFVQHIHRHKEMHYKCGKCHHLCFTKGELQKHLRVHSGTLPFTCHYCSYGAIHKDQLVRHVITLHKEHLYAKEKLEKDQYDKRVATTTGLKLILKRYKIGPTKTFWKRKTVTNGNDESIGKNAQVFNIVSKTQTKSEDQRQEQLSDEKGERLHCENGDKPTEAEKSTLLSTGQYNKAGERANATSSFLKSGVQGPTVLLVRNNKITIPANYSAKFMGFKVVDGRQHIVIKLLPINKPAPALQPNKEKDSTANLPPQSLDNTGFATGVTTEVNDTNFVKAAPLSSSSSVLSKKEISEKEMAFISEKNNVLQTVDNSKSLSSLPTTSESVTASVSLTTKVEATDNVDLWENDATQSHPDVLGTTNIKSPDKVNLTTKPNANSCGDMHNYCINYVSSELPDESSSCFEFCNQVSLPFHNYSKVNNKRRRFSRTAAFESLQRESTNKTVTQESTSDSDTFENLQRDSANKTVTQESTSDSDTLSPPTRKESSDSDSPSAPVSPLDDKDGTLKMKAEIEEPCNLDEGQNFDNQSLFTNENQDLLSVTEEAKWKDIPSAGSPMMPRITSVFSLQSQQASEFLPPEVNQLLQDILKPKSDIKEDSNNIPSENLPLDCDQTLKKAEEEEIIVESSKDFQVQDILPGPSASVGVSMPTNDLNLKCNGQEKQVVSVLQDVRDSEVTAKIPSIITLLKTQSDAIITQQLVKDKLRTTTQNSGPVYIQNPFLTSEQKNPVFVQTPKGFIIPVHVANKPGFPVFSGRPLPLVNTQSVPASLLVNKKPGMLLTLNGKPESVPTVKTESVQSYGTITTEPCKTSFLKVEQNSNCFTPTLCSSVGTCVNMKSCSENTLPLTGPYIIKTPVGSSVRAVHFPNILPEQQQGPKMNILGTGKQQNENLPKASLYTLMPDGKQAVFFKYMMPNNTELLKRKLVRNSPYQYIQPKRPEGAPQKILVKIFNPVLSVSTANNLSVSNSASSFQKENVPSKLAGLGEQKELESSRDALPVSDGSMPANEIVLTSTATCPESSEEPGCISEHSETRVLRCKANCTTERNFSKRKICKNKFAKIKTRISQDSEITIVSRNRSCKRKYIDNYQEPPRKKSTLHRKCREKASSEDVQETFGFSRPRLSKDSGRTLRLFPFNSKQLVKCPRRNQPVVVLNHPDADAPEVERVMKTIAKFNGRVLKVSLSQTTINALLKPVYYNTSETTYNDFSKRHKMLKPANSVKERFVLKLTLKKTSKNNYQIVKTTSEDVLKAKFNCWFCGRVFDNQDVWAGHGQRHLVEATRDWNMLE
ncbi:zinc finger protein 518A [Cricetulus griseus]|uniref:Zinc finger protein 518A n=1 Tax=Cricetulus griseus TaxID=10029 RepID=A0A9J7FM45_CRIGR|nr:zinc finger protein 518A [Cricetulus griseus]XP_027263144.1 zinc finger protein 518A [Cricetulus griseus]XP_027263145.1 zinc finger protein 518A [Cricetulus griseus]XP_027263146.1 zinc finger protein 518A [Cricetulus griseus]XP_027263147.1 zinc finger protein 518A [Cricetulus griseus]XP_027263148.1 zinc finger protein 518A [Cricetulus griseus]XP_027263149.1 zinc finger protein 518A [Cricetulus griseus]XP_027263150.1 zinc finger protein 518A [Cricetulus griseus]